MIESLFVRKLTVVRKYPNMYFPTNTLISAMSFISGMDLMQKSPIGQLFSSWLLTNKLKLESPCHWSKLIELYMQENNILSEKQISVFLDILFEFLNESQNISECTLIE